MDKEKSFKIVGAMSGSSLDGLDLVLCDFYYDTSWHYKVLKSQCKKYSNEWFQLLKNAPNCEANELLHLHTKYGKYLAHEINEFLGGINVDAIASHGHTVFHKPHIGYTLQIGCGIAMSSITNTICITDLRSKDISLGGQGAPIVPIADWHLYKDFKYCLNLGGISNISCKTNNHMIAYDIGVCNQALNYIAQKENKEYDKDGAMAKDGKLNLDLFASLNDLDFYSQPFPKSMSNEWIQQKVIPLIENCNDINANKLNTLIHHIALQIQKAIAIHNDVSSPMLVTGGGAFNTFLIEIMRAKIQNKIVIPDAETINYKEAIAMAFIGLLRMQQKENVLASVTGASRDSVNGVLHIP